MMIGAEERLPHYKPSLFYPVHLRDIFESRYQVLSKLGYGSCSVWLSRDIMFVIICSRVSELTNLYSLQKYVVLKVCISDYPSIERERAAYAHLREVLGTYIGSFETPLLRTALAEFELLKDEKRHWCLVFEPLTVDLVTTRASIQFDEAVFENVAFHVFRALEFLHTKAHMVHCGASYFFMACVKH
jgi:serine/threonine-protein kinase SRPK3